MALAHSITLEPLLQLHLEPDYPLEVRELTLSLAALSHRYEVFVEQHGLLGKGADAKLLVWSVAPGSIDIALIPDYTTVVGLFGAAYSQILHVTEFAKALKDFLALFRKEASSPDVITIHDCDDAINIVNPTVHKGGFQTINIIHGDNIAPIIELHANEAREIAQNALSNRTTMAAIDREFRQRVPLVWKRLDTAKARTDSVQSPDRAIVEEIDPRDRPTFFTDESAFLKRQMIGDGTENPYQMVYFVDVDVSRIAGKVSSYRITGFYGKEPLD